MDDVIFMYVTIASKAEGQKIARVLVEEQLIACANIYEGVHSVYRWQGKVCTEDEAVMILKTKASAYDQTAKRVRELHSYTVPCIVKLPIVGGDAEYLSWLRSCLL